MSTTLNNLTPYSLGIAAVNLELGTDILTVYPQSILPMRDGEVIDAMEETSQTITDSFGRTSSVKISTSNAIKAKWYCQDPNLMTPPNVRRGAKVMLWRQANTDYFYWSTTTNTDNYQKLEERVYGYSNTKNESVDHTKDPNATWTQGVSTLRKEVNLIHTTKSDGEQWAYDINVNAKEGFIVLKDDIDNMIRIDSKNHIIRLQTTDGAFIEINKRNINIGCDNMSTVADSTISEKSTNKTGNYSAGWDTETPVHSQLGNYNITGGITGSPGSGGSGFTITGDINQIGSITSTEDHKAGGISLMHHHHTCSAGESGEPH
jgi:hypothetical protein|nr:MAG TPA: central spike protein [Caudoviricetes sp.]